MTRDDSSPTDSMAPADKYKLQTWQPVQPLSASSTQYPHFLKHKALDHRSHVAPTRRTVDSQSPSRVPLLASFCIWPCYHDDPGISRQRTPVSAYASDGRIRLRYVRSFCCRPQRGDESPSAPGKAAQKWARDLLSFLRSLIFARSQA